MLTRMRLAGLVILLVAAGSLVAGLAAVLKDQSSAPTAAGLVAHPATSATSPSSPSSDKAGTQPAATGAAKRLLRPTAPAGSTSKDQASTEPAQSAAVAPRPTATSSSPSYFTIHNQAHDLCLNAMNHVNAAQVDVATCNGSWYQDWTGLKDGSAEEVVNKESGLCLTAKSVANGADVDIATCQGARSQLWLPDGARLNLEAASSGLCLNGDSPATNESPAGAATCASGTNQKWTW